MRKESSFALPIIVSLAMICARTSVAAPSTDRGPQLQAKEFGVDDYSVTVLPAVSFTSEATCATTGGDLYRGTYCADPAIFYGKVDIPAGAVIDFVGVQRLIGPGGGPISTDLFYVDEYSGTTSGIVNVQSTAESYGTDYNPTPLGWQLSKNAYNALVVTVYLPNYLAEFGWVEIWWKRSISPPPANPSFEDVPTNHPFFSYIEALKASGVTGGCQASPPLFCPDDPLTRGQMAVFLSQALGLHWPETPTPPTVPSGSPAEFGTKDYTVTTMPATSFTPEWNSYPYSTDYGSLARYYPFSDGYASYLAGVSLPSGAVIDYVGLECASTAPGELIVKLFQMHDDGTFDQLVRLANTPHSFDTDYNASPIGFQAQNSHDALVLDVYQAPNSEPLFGWVEIWWHRAVSPAPTTAFFNDVPTSHPLFQYVEALRASGVTGGCQSDPLPLYCPDGSLTRGQMAVFLARALGLHWPN